MVRNNYRVPLCERLVTVLPHGRAPLHLRPYNSIDAVAEHGSKYFIKDVGEVKSFASATTFPFLEDFPAELIDVLRCRDIGCWLLEDDIATVMSCVKRKPCK